MLSEADGEILTKTNAGTPMGELLRRYLIPAILSSEVRHGEAPLRIGLLGEQLIAFRSEDGSLAIVDEFCAHRRASLFYGRNEGIRSSDGVCGIRCAYHGWKYDAQGQCVDMPNEPPSSRFKEHVQITSYKAQERGGVI